MKLFYQATAMSTVRSAFDGNIEAFFSEGVGLKVNDSCT